MCFIGRLHLLLDTYFYSFSRSGLGNSSSRFSAYLNCLDGYMMIYAYVNWFYMLVLCSCRVLIYYSTPIGFLCLIYRAKLSLIHINFWPLLPFLALLVLSRRSFPNYDSYRLIQVIIVFHWLISALSWLLLVIYPVSLMIIFYGSFFYLIEEFVSLLAFCM